MKGPVMTKPEKRKDEILQNPDLFANLPPKLAERLATALKNLEEKQEKQECGPAPLPARLRLPSDRQQRDFFVADLVDYALKDDQATMEAPMFSLSTKIDRELWSWTSVDGKKTVHVAPGFYGRATMHDKDVLIYCTSQMVAAINKGEEPPRVVRFIAYDFLMATGRGTRSDDYDHLRDALNRLKGTQITTNIITGKGRRREGFGLIDSWSIIEKSPTDSRMVALEVKISDWLFDAIYAKEVLTINREYFGLRKPLERRLYEIARKHVGKQGLWDIGIENLREKCGSKTERIRQFKGALEAIIEADTLPDFRMVLREEGAMVRFYARDLEQLLKRFPPKIEGRGPVDN
jgi:plasmid replication initiation protein